MQGEDTPSKNDFTNKLTNLFSFSKDDEDVPEPGSEANPWIGPYDKKTGKTVPMSGDQLRTARRAQERREAAQQRVGQRAYNRQQKAQRRADALVSQRQRVLNGEIQVPDALYQNIVREAERLLAAPTDEQVALRRQQMQNKRDDDLADRREARFRAGQPRGKDLREDTYNEYEAFLPDSARNRSKS